MAAAVIQLCCPAIGMTGNPLSGFKGAVIFQEIRDAGCPEQVWRIVRREPSLFEPSFKHIRGIGAGKRPTRSAVQILVILVGEWNSSIAVRSRLPEVRILRKS